jgi:hypothetical protein
MKPLSTLQAAIGRVVRGAGAGRRSRAPKPPRSGIPRVAGLVVLLLLSSAGIGLAQTLQTSLWTTDGSVLSIVSDGSTVYVGGGFNYVGPATGSAVAIDASTGAVQQPYPRVTNTLADFTVVRAVAPDGSGGWYLGGDFTSVRGVARNYLAHLDAAGNLTAWNPNPNNTVTTLVVSGGTVYAGGTFTSIGGQTRNRIAALDPVTGAATAWDPDANGQVDALAVSAGTVYAGGSFTAMGPSARNRIAALNAMTGAADAWNPNADGPVYTLVVAGGLVYAGGSFANIGGQPRGRIAALDPISGAASPWNPNAQWTAIPPPSTQPIFAEVRALAIAGSTVYVAGTFDRLGGQTRRWCAAVDASSGLATDWYPGVSGVGALVVDGGTVYLGGSFATVGGQSRRNLAAVDASTAVPTAWNPNMIRGVNALAVSGGTVYAGGSFVSAGAQVRGNLAALDPSSGAATAWNPGADSYVAALALGDGTVYAGGNFTSIGGQSRSRIAAIDATTGSVTAWDPSAQLSDFGQNLTVDAMAVSGGTVYAGGTFDAIGGQPRNKLAAIDATTGLATSWNPNVQYPEAHSPSARVRALALGAGKIYAGGSFSMVGGLARHHIAAIDATTGVPTAWNPTAQDSDPTIPGTVHALALSGGRVYAGGNFVGIGGQPRANLAALEETTGLATAFNANLNLYPVHALVASANVLYVGGVFGTIGGQSRSCIAALDPVTGAANSWNPNASGFTRDVKAMLVSAGKVYAGGYFLKMSGQPHQYLAALTAVDVPTATLLARFDASSTDDGIELRWSFGDAGRVSTVEVERARDAAGPWLAITPERRDEPGATVAVDRAPGETGEHFYRLVVQLADGDRMMFGPVSARYGRTPLRDELAQLSPNPTSGGIQVHYAVAREGRARLEVLDVSGRVAETLADRVHAPGRYVLAWDGASRGGRPAPGLYFVRLVTPHRVTTSRLAIVR